MKYNLKIDDWDFAIYKYSRDKYDPEEWFFPGSEFVNGTIEGAMKAGMQAYPPSDHSGAGLLKDWLALLFGRGK